MNVPRYWRKNTQRYRLVGVQYEDGQKSIVNRPQLSQANDREKFETTNEERNAAEVHAA